MAAAKPKIHARDVAVDSRALEAVLMRSARAEELATIALQTIAAVSQDLRALTQEIRTFNARTGSTRSTATE